MLGLTPRSWAVAACWHMWRYRWKTTCSSHHYRFAREKFWVERRSCGKVLGSLMSLMFTLVIIDTSVYITPDTLFLLKSFPTHIGYRWLMVTHPLWKIDGVSTVSIRVCFVLTKLRRVLLTPISPKNMEKNTKKNSSVASQRWRCSRGAKWWRNRTGSKCWTLGTGAGWHDIFSWICYVDV